MTATSNETEYKRPVALGMANGDIPEDPVAFTPDLVRSWRERGIACLAVRFGRPNDAISLDVLARLRTALANEGIRVSQFVGVNANLVHPDPVVRADAVRRVQRAVPGATEVGARAIQSGAGTCSPTWWQNFYRPHAGNFASEAEDSAVETLSRIGEVIGDADLLYTIECHQLCTFRSPEVIRRILDRVDHPKIKANFDPVNMLDTAYAAYTSAERIAEMVEIVGPRYAPTCHIKDIGVGDEMPLHTNELPPGQGLIDIDTIFAAAQRLPGDGTVDMLVEHLSVGDSAAGVEFARQAAIRLGIQLE